MSKRVCTCAVGVCCSSCLGHAAVDVLRALRTCLWGVGWLQGYERLCLCVWVWGVRVSCTMSSAPVHTPASSVPAR